MGKDYYKTLGLSRNATADEIRRAYKKYALKYHPDKSKQTGAEEKFKSVAEAYEVLSDERKRNIYDQLGEEGLRNASSDSQSGVGSSSYTWSGDPNHTFREFFNRSNPFYRFFGNDDDDDLMSFGLGGRGSGGAFVNNQQQRKPQDPPVFHDLNVSLEEIYTGTTKKMKIARKVLNQDGRTTRVEDKVLTIEIKPGWKSGTKITFPREGDQSSDALPADVTFIIRDKPHTLFQRSNANIIHKKTITLRQALCGAEITVPTLDNKKKHLTINEVITPETIRILPGEGLPISKSSKRGDLIVRFDIRFPENLSKDARHHLDALLS